MLCNYITNDDSLSFPSFPAPPPDNALLSFSRRGLADSLKTNWSENAGTIWFGQGHARREVLVDIGFAGEERGKLETGVEAFRSSVERVYGDEHGYSVEERRCRGDVVV